MQRKTAIILRAAAALALAAICASTALAQEEATDAKIAVVSLARVQANYGQLRAQEQDLGQWLEGRRAYHDRLTNFVFLPSADFEEALELMRKPQPLSDEDQARLDELQSISDANEERYAELRARTERTPEEAAEFNALQDMYDASAEKLQTVQQNIMEELTDRRESALAGLMDTVEDAIGLTAEAGGYDLVIDADMVFYGGVDITDDVLARLNGDDEQPADADADAENGDGEQGEQGGAEGGEETGGQDG
ncbi:MAG: OmpH family outer membrane protein [Armatimonadota bacterium]